MLVVGNVNYVKKVVFPLESLGWSALLSAAFHFLVSLSILLLAQVLLTHEVPWTWLLLPVVALPLLVLCIGTNWLLSSLGVFIRDLPQFTGILATVLLFLSPIFYPIEVIPEPYRIFMLLNPLSFIVTQAREILIFEQLPNFAGLAFYLLVAGLFSGLSYRWFATVKNGFADVL